MPAATSVAIVSAAQTELSARVLASATTCLRLGNLAKPAQRTQEEELDEILEDATEEASKSGRVLSALICKPSSEAALEAAGTAVALEDAHRPPPLQVGELLLQFEDSAGCAGAYSALQGRVFDGRSVVAAFAPPAWATAVAASSS